MKLKIPQFWQKRSFLSYLLLPCAAVFTMLSALRRIYYRYWRKSSLLPVPIIVVGNLTVGGAGKTPLIIYLVEQLQEIGYRVGVVSRGYGRRDERKLCVVDVCSKASEVGDEPLLIFRRTQAVVVVAADRYAAAEQAIALGCQVILSDDGLQHYRLPRVYEIIVIDQHFGLGNGFMLPAGPLREGSWRLKTTPWVIWNGNHDFGAIGHYRMRVRPLKFKNLVTGEELIDFTIFVGKKITAVAGIGAPARFFATLRDLGLTFKECTFSDHHVFCADDFAELNDTIIIMTEKDAVKCMEFAHANFWCLLVTADLNQVFCQDFFSKWPKPK